VAGGAHLHEGALCLVQETRTFPSLAERHGQARAFLDQERNLGARTGLGDERLGTRQAVLDGGPALSPGCVDGVAADWQATEDD